MLEGVEYIWWEILDNYMHHIDIMKVFLKIIDYFTIMKISDKIYSFCE